MCERDVDTCHICYVRASSGSGTKWLSMVLFRSDNVFTIWSIRCMEEESISFQRSISVLWSQCCWFNSFVHSSFDFGISLGEIPSIFNRIIYCKRSRQISDSLLFLILKSCNWFWIYNSCSSFSIESFLPANTSLTFANNNYGTEAEIQLPLKRSSRFQRLFPNPSWLVWGRTSRYQKLAPTFPGIDSCLMATKQDFLEMEASLWLNGKSQMLLKVDCLPNAVGKQPSMPLIYFGRKWTLNWWWWWWIMVSALWRMWLSA